MSCLLDTSAISEWAKPGPAPGPKVNGLQVVARNAGHFRHTGADVISPWQG